MRISQFDELIKELGTLINIELGIDGNDACLITYPEGADIQLELSEDDRDVVLGSFLGEVPAGRFREDLFQAALQANGSPGRSIGILCFLERSDQLCLYDRVGADQLTASKLKDAINTFRATASDWQEAIENNQVPDMGGGIRTSGGGMFGMRP